MPLYGILINLCYKINWFTPIIWLTIYFCETYNKSPTQKNAKTLLALNHNRFRNDLEILANSNNFKIIILPHFWMCRLQYALYKGPVSFDTIFKPSHEDKIHHEKLSKFTALFMPKLYAKMGIDGVVSAANHYISDYLWGSQSSKNGAAYIILHKENLYASEAMQQYKKKLWSKVPDFTCDLLIVHNTIMRDIFIESGIVDKTRCYALGAMRMDQFLKKYWHKPTPLQDQKQVTLFSFTHRIGVGDGIPHWYEESDNHEGFINLFKETHYAFALFAKNNPNVKCVIKPKWGGKWTEQIENAVQEHGLNLSDIPNIEIDITTPAPKLIENSRAVLGYSSTTLLESVVIGDREIIISLLGEANRPDYKGRIFLEQDLSNFKTAENVDELIEILEEVTKDEPVKINKETQKKREEIFERWISPSSAKATENYIKHINQAIEKKKSA